MDKKAKGVYKSRLTCADVKRPAVEADGETFSPTPQPASHRILEVIALKNGWNTRSADATSAFLHARDPGDACGQPVYVYPPEYEAMFWNWLYDQPEEVQKEFEGCDFKEVVRQLDANLYGRPSRMCVQGPTG